MTSAQLLTDQETEHDQGTDWFTVRTTDTTDEPETFHPCARSTLSSLGATATVRRDFEMRSTEDPTLEIAGAEFTETVAQFPDTGTAAAAMLTISAWLEDCTDQLPDHAVLQTVPVPVSAAPDAQAQITEAHCGGVPAGLDDGTSKHIAATGLVRVGDRLAVLALVVIADYNFLPEAGGTPVTRMIPPAAALLPESS